MTSATRTEAFPSHAFGYGYMQGAIKGAMIYLECGLADKAMAELTRALELSERPHDQVTA